MVLSNDKINSIISKCAEHSHDVRVRDVSYAILSRFYEDKEVAYRCIFGDDGMFELYSKSKAIVFLEKYLKENVFYDDSKDITFEENKAYMLKLKRDTEAAMESGDIEKKDGLKILSDISVKLNDKFSVSEEVKEQIVQIWPKYDYICPRCQTEVARRPMTKEEAMREFNLVEKT